jgi:hypothetical protein
LVSLFREESHPDGVAIPASWPAHRACRSVSGNAAMPSGNGGQDYTDALLHRMRKPDKA